jgi:hypothetical protein
MIELFSEAHLKPPELISPWIIYSGLRFVEKN